MKAALKLHELLKIVYKPDHHVVRHDLRMIQRTSCASMEVRTSDHLYKVHMVNTTNLIYK